MDAWSAARAAASGRAAVEVVDRVVEVEVQVPVRVEVQVPVHPRGGPAWGTALRELAAQLETGAIADRDIPEFMGNLELVVNALRGRPAFRRIYRINWPPDPR